MQSVEIQKQANLTQCRRHKYIDKEFKLSRRQRDKITNSKKKVMEYCSSVKAARQDWSKTSLNSINYSCNGMVSYEQRVHMCSVVYSSKTFGESNDQISIIATVLLTCPHLFLLIRADLFYIPKEKISCR